MRKALETLSNEQLIDLCCQQQSSLTLLSRKVAEFENGQKPVRRRWTNADLKQITMMLSQGARVSEVALYFSVDSKALYSICQRKGIKVRRLQAGRVDLPIASNAA